MPIGDWHIPGKVIAIIPTADRQKATVKVRVGFDQLDPRILPDMGVKVAFQSAGDGSRSDGARERRDSQSRRCRTRMDAMSSGSCAMGESSGAR